MIDKFTNYDFPLFGMIRLPEIVLSNKEKHDNGAPLDCTNNHFLRILTKNGFAKRIQINKYLKENFQKYIDKVDEELTLFEQIEMIDYVLLVWRVYNFCNQNDIFTGPGRGSCASSTVFYLLGLTQRDPIKDGLFIERFVSTVRSKKKIIDGIIYLDGSLVADVDIDIQQDKRNLVVDYINQQYPGKVCKISTINTLSTKLLLKDTYKVISECSEREATEVAAMVPKTSGIVMDIVESYETEAPFKKWCDQHREVYDIACKLRELNRNSGVHPSGYAISFDPLEGSLPMHFNTEKELVTDYAMSQASRYVVKLDLLGLRCCSVVNDVQKQLGINLSLIDVDNDPIIYDNFQKDIQAMGIFQIEAPTALRVLTKVKPKNIYELADVMSIARPGALSFLDKYIANDKPEIYPLIDKILSTTRGCCLYQEQMMKMIHAIGFTLDEAETCRKIVGKKLVDKVKEWKKKIEDKCVENGHPKELGELMWKILEDSSKYSFNLSHALCYSHLAAITAYLKFKYPQNFFLALLKQAQNEPDPIAEITKIQGELKYFDINLLPPHLLKSDFDFKIDGRDIRFGLSSIKGISDAAMKKLIAFRKPHTNKFELFESANEAKIPINILSALIQAGAMEEKSYKMTRSRLVLEAQLWNILKDHEKVNCHEFAKEHDFNYDLMKIIKFLSENKDEKGKLFIKESRLATIKKNYQPAKDIYLLNSKSERLCNFVYEFRLLGFSYSSKLFDLFKDDCDDLEPIDQVKSYEEGERVTFIGFITEIKTWTSKEKKTKCLKINMRDESSAIDVMMFNDKILDLKESNGKLPGNENLILVKGIKKDNCVFADIVSVQDDKVYMKYSEIKQKSEK